MSDRDLVTHLARFARGLREAGVPVGLSDEIDGALALTLVDISDRDEVKRALAASLRIRPRDLAVFLRLFELLWSDRGGGREGRRLLHRAEGRASSRRAGSGLGTPAATQEQAAAVDGESPGYSAQALLRKKPFDQYSEHDLSAMEQLLGRLALGLATRPGRRLVPAKNRGWVDLRRSLRGAVKNSGELLALARRTHAIVVPRLVLLCDTSGSMDPHTRFLLTFVLSLRKVSRRTEVFAFNTSLTRLTPWLSPTKVRHTLERLAAGVPDWAGGTRIGECLADFVAHHADGLVDARTVVVILSDGLDRGETGALVHAMRALHSRASRVIWLNPLMGDARYRPEARGMAAALPYVDILAPAHNLESLERLVTMVAA